MIILKKLKDSAEKWATHDFFDFISLDNKKFWSRKHIKIAKDY